MSHFLLFDIHFVVARVNNYVKKSCSIFYSALLSSLDTCKLPVLSESTRDLLLAVPGQATAEVCNRYCHACAGRCLVLQVQCLAWL